MIGQERLRWFMTLGETRQWVRTPCSLASEWKMQRIWNLDLPALSWSYIRIYKMLQDASFTFTGHEFSQHCSTTFSVSSKLQLASSKFDCTKDCRWTGFCGPRWRGGSWWNPGRGKAHEGGCKGVAKRRTYCLIHSMSIAALAADSIGIDRWSLGCCRALPRICTYRHTFRSQLVFCFARGLLDHQETFKAYAESEACQSPAGVGTFYFVGNCIHTVTGHNRVLADQYPLSTKGFIVCDRHGQVMKIEEDADGTRHVAGFWVLRWLHLQGIFNSDCIVFCHGICLVRGIHLCAVHLQWGTCSCSFVREVDTAKQYIHGYYIIFSLILYLYMNTAVLYVCSYYSFCWYVLSIHEALTCRK